MRFQSSLTTQDDAALAAGELVASIQEADLPSVDLAALFVTPHLAEGLPHLLAEIQRELAPRTLIGCTAEGVIGAVREVERSPGASLWCASLPGVDLRPFRLTPEELPALIEQGERLQQRVGTGEAHRGQIVLADPLSTPITELLQALDEAFPAGQTLGGMASGPLPDQGNLLLLDDNLQQGGVVGIGLGGSMGLSSVVSQGCRPIGQPLVVTKSEQNVILELSRRPPLVVVQELLSGLPPNEMEMVQNGLFCGLVIDEYQDEFRRGDFLVRNLMGMDRDSGAIVVGEAVRPGQTIQFHVRDAETADEDLRELLAAHHDAHGAPQGALLFSCNGRGTQLFPRPHHDAQALDEALPDLAVAGFFAAGELGPVGGRSFIHGHTASVAFFHELDASGPA